MGLDTHERQQTDYFIGTEVEHTSMYGEKTLFIVGVKPVNDIIERALAHGIRHLYFGTSQSFTPETTEQWNAWEKMIIELLDKKFWCTLDFDVKYTEQVLNCGFDEYNNYISMISVKLPHLRQFNYNATLKIDDTTWGYSNPGVWCHSLEQITNSDNFTGWEDYPEDTRID